MLNKKIKTAMAGLILSSVLSGCTVQDFADFAGNTTSDFFCLLLNCG